MPEISVVMPLYNKAGYVKRAVNSILGQTFHDFEIIVVNNNSTDGSEKIVEQFNEPRIKMFNKETPSPGGHAARNLGIKNASAGLIAFLDADDEWKPEFLKTIIRLRDRFPEAGAYATSYEEKKSSGRTKIPKFWYIPAAENWEGIIPDYFKSSLYGASPVWTSAVSIPKYVFEASGFFPEGVRRGGDLDMWARIALRFPIAFSRYAGAVYYKDIPGSVIKTNVILEGYRIVDTLEGFLNGNRDIPAEKRKHITEYANKFRLSSAAHCIKAGRIKLAKAHLAECRTKKFFIRRSWLQFNMLFPRKIRK